MDQIPSDAPLGILPSLLSMASESESVARVEVLTLYVEQASRFSEHLHEFRRSFRVL